MKMTIGRRIIHLDEVTSTNDVAKRHAKEGEAEGLVIVAKRQTQGRGRQGREWVSPEGGLYLSILLRPGFDPKELTRLTVYSAVPVAKAIEKVTGLRTEMKWPNDIQIEGRKVAGLLVEGSSQQGKIAYVVLGIGINVNTAPQELGVEGASSLSEETGRTIDLEQLLDEVLRELRSHYERFLKGEYPKDDYVRRSSILGHQIEAVVGREVLRGKALHLAPDGALVIKSEEGLVLRLAWVNDTSIRATDSVKNTDNPTKD
jgi:BirA family biotin operon repressor/biotin-[acetyl-CoA-carboxylase] ligase